MLTISCKDLDTGIEKRIIVDNMADIYEISNIVKKVPNVEYEKIFKYVGFSVVMFEEFNNCEDFIFQYVTSTATVFGLDVSPNMVGKLFTKIFPKSVDLGALDILKKVFKEDVVVKSKIEIYDDGVFIHSYSQKCFKDNNKILIFTNNTTKEDLIESREDILYDFEKQSVIIFDENGDVLKVNKHFVFVTGYSKDKLNKLGGLTWITQHIKEIVNDEGKVTNINNDFVKLLNKELLFFDFELCIIVDSKEVWFKVHGINIQYKKQNAIQVNCVDITEQKILREESLNIRNDLKVLQGISKIAIVRWDPVNKYQWTSEIYNILDIKKDQFSSDVDLLYKFAIPRDKQEFKNRFIYNDRSSPNFKMILRVMTGNITLKYLSIQTTFNVDENGLILSYVGFVQDITDQRLAKNILTKTLKEKEQLIEDKEVLLKEVHHRVKNNLQVILSLIDLENNLCDIDYKEIMGETKARINALALIHENIYKSEDLININLKNYINSEVVSIFDIYNIKNIDLELDLEDVFIDMEKAIPIGLILNELINNSIKHGFPENENGFIKITLKSVGNEVTLLIEDDGVGLPDDFEIEDISSFGLSIVNNLVDQIEGNFKHIKTDNGVLFEFTFENN